MVKEEILKKLNSQQKEAAVNIHGPVLINAAPGSGKTATLIARAAYMIASGIAPENILLFTFTRKAANEIKERVIREIGEKGAAVTVGTYHSFCCRLLLKYAECLGYEKGFSIYDEEDSSRILKKTAKERGIDEKRAAGEISWYKKKLIKPSMAVAEAESDDSRKYALCYQEYQRRLKENNAMDFDDLIFNAIDILSRFPEVKEEVNRRFTYITCDEGHDSSENDLVLISLLGGDLMNVCFIMDSDQSIYGFRGADMAAVYDFLEVCGFRQFNLEQNYRSTKTIVNAASGMIHKNGERVKKEVFTENEQGEKIVFRSLKDADSEADFIVRIIMSLKSRGFSYKDIAVLYRMQFLSRRIEEALLKNEIPYRITGSCPFYERKEIKDILAWLRLITNPRDREAFERVVSFQADGAGKKALEAVYSVKSTQNVLEKTEEAVKKNLLSKKACESMSDLLRISDTLKEQLGNSPPHKILEEAVRLSRYRERLKEEKTEEYRERTANIRELVEISRGYESVEDFLGSVMINETSEEEKNAVYLMTLHASKGLEFPAVILPGVNEGMVPHYRSMETGDVREERRLFYVGMTRAEKLLFITRAERMPEGGILKYQKKSRFLGEIPSEYILEINARR